MAFAPLRMHICSKSYAPGKPAMFVILIDHVYYRVPQIVLGLLEAGKTPQQLDLDPMENFDDQ